MNYLDKAYLDLMQDVLDNGVVKETRSGKVRSVFGRQLRFNLKDGLPVLTTKKVFSRGCIEELLWFIKGSTNIKYLVEHNVHIWDDDAYRHYKNVIKTHNDLIESDSQLSFYDETIIPDDKETFLQNVLANKCIRVCTKCCKTSGRLLMKTYTYGDLGPVYGKQWRNFGVKGIDQLQQVIDTLKTNPDDRRMLVIAFNPDVLDDVALPPCHILFQFYTKPLPNGKRELNCMWTQRSVDLPLGWALNVMSYSILTHMIAQCCDMEVGEILCSLGDVHIYENQIEGCKEQLSHDPHKYDLPKLWLNPEIKDINQFTIDDIKVEGYESYPKVFFPLSVG